MFKNDEAPKNFHALNMDKTQEKLAVLKMDGAQPEQEKARAEQAEEKLRALERELEALKENMPEEKRLEEIGILNALCLRSVSELKDGWGSSKTPLLERRHEAWDLLLFHFR